MQGEEKKRKKLRKLQVIYHVILIGAVMATSKLLALACIRNESSSYRDLLTSTPKYPKVVSGPVKTCSRAILLSVKGMTCSACAVSIEKAIKRLPGIHDAVVDVLNNRAQVLFYPFFVNVSNL